MNIAFIIASPRSGTTFLEEIFNLHPQVCGWHEPYFIWKYYLKRQKNDFLDESSVTPKIKKFVRQEFSRYLANSNKQFLLEKTPNNAFKIRYMNAIFPEAKWIHLYRDGRDVISSMKIRYEYRKNLVLNKSLKKFISDIYYTLHLQSYWRYKVYAVWYELKHLDHIQPYLNLNKQQWQASSGWGPRYPNWQSDRKKFSDIEFMAMQWLKSEEYIQRDINIIKRKNILHVKYEDLLKYPENQFEKILDFLDLAQHQKTLLANDVLQNNSNKWRINLTQDEIKKITPIISNMLQHYNYNEKS